MEQQGNYGYSTGGYTISGLQRLENTSGEIRDGWRETRARKRYSDEDKNEMIRLHEEGKSWTMIARMYGISKPRINQILKGKVKFATFYPKVEMTAQKMEYLIHNYSTTMNSELADNLGMGKTTLRKWAIRLGLEKDNSHLKEQRAKLVTKECIEKKVASYHKTRTSEKRRVLYGMEQKTRLKIGRTHSLRLQNGKTQKFTSRRDHKYRMKQRGYISERASKVIYYDENTNRHLGTEETARKWGYEVKEYGK